MSHCFGWSTAYEFVSPSGDWAVQKRGSATPFAEHGGARVAVGGAPLHPTQGPLGKLLVSGAVAKGRERSGALL